jgi:hypothetical protein
MCLSPDDNWIVAGRFDLDKYQHAATVKESTPVEVWLIKTEDLSVKCFIRGQPNPWGTESGLRIQNG